MAKMCYVCKKIKEIEDFGISSNHISGRNNKCKACHAQYNKIYVVLRRKSNKKTKEKITVEKKHCLSCFQEKLINKFPKCHSSKDGYRNKCSECNNAVYRQRKIKNYNSHINDDFIKCSICNELIKHEKYSKSGLYLNNPRCRDCYREKVNTSKGRTSISVSCKISQKEFDGLLKKQNYVCAICGEHETQIRKGVLSRLCVDHCHKSEEKGINKIRGLLCSKCNTGIGLLKDCSITLRKAADYLDMHNENP